MAKLEKHWEKKLRKDFKVYYAYKKEALTLFEKDTGLFKASIHRCETFIIPQFVYDLHIENTSNGSVIQTYDTFDEAVIALLTHV